MEKEPFVVATGGLAKLISEQSSNVDIVNPFLTLEGLRIIYEKNKSRCFDENIEPRI